MITKSRLFSSSASSSSSSTTIGNERTSVTQKDANNNNNTKSFENFDYMAHWYPVIWAEDLIPNKPTKVTLFDQDYVVALTTNKNAIKNDDKDNVDKTQVICLLDKCPHKSAALSEGRITSAGYFQCAYHGWSFQGTTGECMEIPQIVKAQDNDNEDIVNTMSRRTCAQAIPAMIHQRMVWLFPGGTQEALLAPPPPTIAKELDSDEFKVTTVVRDFPVDWAILLENILDPDHGVFAHGALAFDQYSADPSNPQHISEEFTNGGKGWTITSRVPAVDKLLQVDLKRRTHPKKKKSKTVDIGKTATPKLSTSTFAAPNHVAMSRRDPDTDETAFVTAFWVTPTGTGRSRFMSCSAGKTPITIPRWILNVALENFLDQDTYLLMGQQKHALLAEAAAAKEGGSSSSSNVRKKTYAYRSPTEKLGARLGAFWDATLSKAPNRIETLLQMERRGDLVRVPSRRFVLDREVQHLNICPSSQDVVRNCRSIQKFTILSSIVIGLAKTLCTTVLTSSSQPNSWIAKVNSLLKPRRLVGLSILSILVLWLSEKLRKEFYFKYDERLRDKDLLNIPKVWQDRQATTTS